MKPWIHAESSARRFGGKPEDYLDIHNLMDSSKGAIADNRHRALTHTSWFLSVILEKIFGVTITNSSGKKVSVRDVGEQHIMEDYRGKFIPTPQDFLQNLPFEEWMDNGKGSVLPSSCRKLHEEAPKIIDLQIPMPVPTPVQPFYPDNPNPIIPMSPTYPSPMDNYPRIID